MAFEDFVPPPPPPDSDDPFSDFVPPPPPPDGPEGSAVGDAASAAYWGAVDLANPFISNVKGLAVSGMGAIARGANAVERALAPSGGWAVPENPRLGIEDHRATMAEARILNELSDVYKGMKSTATGELEALAARSPAATLVGTSAPAVGLAIAKPELAAAVFAQKFKEAALDAGHTGFSASALGALGGTLTGIAPAAATAAVVKPAAAIALRTTEGLLARGASEAVAARVANVAAGATVENVAQAAALQAAATGTGIAIDPSTAAAQLKHAPEGFLTNVVLGVPFAGLKAATPHPAFAKAQEEARGARAEQLRAQMEADAEAAIARVQAEQAQAAAAVEADQLGVLGFSPEGFTGMPVVRRKELTSPADLARMQQIAVTKPGVPVPPKPAAAAVPPKPAAAAVPPKPAPVPPQAWDTTAVTTAQENPGYTRLVVERLDGREVRLALFDSPSADGRLRVGTTEAGAKTLDQLPGWKGSKIKGVEVVDDAGDPVRMILKPNEPAPAPVAEAAEPAPAPVAKAAEPAPAPVVKAAEPAPAPVAAPVPAPVAKAAEPAPAPVAAPAPAPVAAPAPAAKPAKDTQVVLPEGHEVTIRGEVGAEFVDYAGGRGLIYKRADGTFGVASLGGTAEAARRRVNAARIKGHRIYADPEGSSFPTKGAALLRLREVRGKTKAEQRDVFRPADETEATVFRKSAKTRAGAETLLKDALGEDFGPALPPDVVRERLMGLPEDQRAALADSLEQLHGEGFDVASVARGLREGVLPTAQENLVASRDAADSRAANQSEAIEAAGRGPTKDRSPGVSVRDPAKETNKEIGLSSKVGSARRNREKELDELTDDIMRTMEDRDRLPEGSPERAALDKTIADLTAEASKIRLVESVPTHLSQVSDGLSSADRDVQIRGLAKALGVNLGRVGSPLEHSGKSIKGGIDSKGVVHLGEVGSMAEAAYILAHEAVHVQVRKAPELLAQVKKVLGKQADEILKDLPDELSTPAKHDEALATAAADAFLQRPDAVLASFTSKTAVERAIAALHRVGQALIRSARALVGNPDARAELRAMGSRLLRQTAEGVASRQSAAERTANNLDDLVRMVRVARDARADLGDKYASSLRKIGMPGETFRRGAVYALEKIDRVARRFPEAARVLAAADRTESLRVREEVDAFKAMPSVLSRSRAESERLGEMLLRLRFASQRVYETSGRHIPRPRAEEMLREWGATDADVHAAAEAFTATARQTEMVLEAAASAAGEKVMTAREYEAEAASTSDPDRKAMLEALAATAERVDDLLSGYYIPAVRESAASHFVRVRPDKDGETSTYYATMGEKSAARVAAEMEKLYPGRVESAAFSQKQRGSGDITETKILGLISKAGVDDAVAADFLAAVRPLLVRGTAKAHMLHAKGVAGYRTDLREVLPEFVGRMATARRKMRLRAETVEPILEAGERRKAAGGVSHLQEFLQQFVTDVTSVDRSAVASLSRTARAIVYGTTLASPIQAPMNIAGGMMFSPAKVAALTGSKSATASATVRSAAAVFETAENIVRASLRGVGRGTQFIGGQRLGQAIRDANAVSRSHYRRATTSADERAAIDRLFEEHPDLVDNTAALEIDDRSNMSTMSAALTIMGHEADRAERVAGFLTAHRAAQELTPAGWARLRENGYAGKQDAFEASVWMAREIGGRYGKAHRPEMLRGPVGAMASQFTSWARVVTDHTVDVTERAAKGDLAATAALTQLVGLGAAMGGVVAGVPLLSPFVTAYDKAMTLLDSKHEDFNTKLNIAEREAGRNGDTATEAMYRMARLGVMDGAMSAAAPRGLALSPLENPRIAAMSRVQDVVGGMAAANRGDDAEASELLFRGVAGPYATKLRDAATGQPRTRAGDPLLPESKGLTAGERAQSVFGSSPRRVSAAYEALAGKREVKRAYGPHVDRLVADYAQAYIDHDKPGQKALSDEIRRLAKEAQEDVKAAPNETERSLRKARLVAFQGLQYRLRNEILLRMYGITRPVSNASSYWVEPAAEAEGLRPEDADLAEDEAYDAALDK